MHNSTLLQEAMLEAFEALSTQVRDALSKSDSVLASECLALRRENTRLTTENDRLRADNLHLSSAFEADQDLAVRLSKAQTRLWDIQRIFHLPDEVIDRALADDVQSDRDDYDY